MDTQSSKRPSNPPPPLDSPFGLPVDAGQRPTGPQPPSVNAMIRRTLAHWYIAVIVMALGAALTGAFVASRKPAYRSETVIFYREGVRSTYIGPDGPDPLRTLSARLKETLLARSNLEKVVTEFNLYPDVLSKRGMVDAVERLRSKVVFRTKSPDTFAISFDGTTREEAQEVTARLAELLVEENTRVRQSQAKITSEFLFTQQKQAEQELEKAEKDLAKFFADHPEFAQETSQPGGSQAGASIRAEQRRASEGDPALEALQRQLPRLKSQLNPGAPGSPGSPQPPAALTQQKQQADEELATARRDLADKQARFTDSHPDVRAALGRVAAAEAAARRAENAISSWQPDPAPGVPAENPAAEKARVQAQLAEVEREISKRKRAQAVQQQEQDTSDTAKQIIDVETEWARLNREVARARQRVMDLEAKTFRAEIAANSEEGGYAAQISVLDPAFKPTSPSTPPRSMLALAGLAASFFLGLALAAARGIVLDDRIYDAEDVDRLGLVPVLGVVPGAPRRGWGRRG